MEAFFIQKRFLLSTVLPELLLKEENLNLRFEISRKDELIKKHYDRIETWKATLSDQHPAHQQIQNIPPPPPPAAISGPSMAMGSTGDMRGMPMGGMGGVVNMPPGNPQGPMVGGPMGGMPNPMQVRKTFIYLILRCSP